MSTQYSRLASGAWNKLSFVEQMANIGSEVIRATKWKQKGNHDYSTLAFHRSLELLSFSFDDEKNKSRLKELTRTYAVLVDFFAGDNVYQSTNENLNKIFMSYTYAASLGRSVQS